MKQYYVYILSNKRGTLYIGMTNDLERRLYEHKSKTIPSFTSKYNIDRLLFFETFPSPNDAIIAEKKNQGLETSTKNRID